MWYTMFFLRKKANEKRLPTELSFCLNYKWGSVGIRLTARSWKMPRCLLQNSMQYNCGFKLSKRGSGTWFTIMILKDRRTTHWYNNLVLTVYSIHPLTDCHLLASLSLCLMSVTVWLAGQQHRINFYILSTTCVSKAETYHMENLILCFVHCAIL